MEIREDTRKPPREVSGGRGIGRWFVAACAVFGAVCLIVVVVAFPSGTPVSSDAGAPAVPIWVTVAPALAGIALALLLPRRPPALRAVAVRRDRLLATTGILLGLALAFPLTVGLLRVQGEMYILAKLVLLMLVPAAIVLAIRDAVRLEVHRAAWRWWAPAAVVAVWTLLSQVAPWNPSFDFAGMDPAFVAVAALATAVTAGVGEELFYSRWLQTRLEALIGPWPGIALTSVAFALMHLGSHGTGEPFLDVARVVVAQGSFGLLVGVLWWRYRNLTLIIAAHLIVNGWGVVAAMLRT
jgi:membrane protease YdiL (CAAX protease family)